MASLTYDYKRAHQLYLYFTNIIDGDVNFLQKVIDNIIEKSHSVVHS